MFSFTATNFETADSLIASGAWLDVGTQATLALETVHGPGRKAHKRERWLMATELQEAVCRGRHTEAAAATLRVILQRLFWFERTRSDLCADSFDFPLTMTDGLAMRVVRNSESFSKECVVLLSFVARTDEKGAPAVLRQNFTQFAAQNGFVDNYNCLDHADLSPSGRRSKSGQRAMGQRARARMDSNREGLRLYQAEIEAGTIIDPSRRYMPTPQWKFDKIKAAECAGIRQQIKSLQRVGKGKRGIYKKYRILIAEKERKLVGIIAMSNKEVRENLFSRPMSPNSIAARGKYG